MPVAAGSPAPCSLGAAVLARQALEAVDHEREKATQRNKKEGQKGLNGFTGCDCTHSVGRRAGSSEGLCALIKQMMLFNYTSICEGPKL